MMDSIAGPIQVLSRQFPNAQQGKGAALNHAFQIVLADAEKRLLTKSNIGGSSGCRWFF